LTANRLTDNERVQDIIHT